MTIYIMIYLAIAITSYGVFHSNNNTLITVYFWLAIIGITLLYFMDSVHWIFLFITTLIPFELTTSTFEEDQQREQENTIRRLAHEEYERKQAADNRRSSPDHF